jgi:hypothetical protein
MGSITEVRQCPMSGAEQTLAGSIFHNIGSAKRVCSRKAKMSALSKVGMSVFFLLVREDWRLRIRWAWWC